MVLYAGGVLAAPARAAQASVGKQGAALAAAEGEVTRTASAALHMLFAIKRWAPELGGVRAGGGVGRLGRATRLKSASE